MPAAAAQMQPLAWEPPYAAHVTLKDKKTKKKKNKNKQKKKNKKKTQKTKQTKKQNRARSIG